MESKTYVFGNEGSTSNNGMLGLLAPLLQKQGVDPNVLLAMKGNNGFGGEGGWFIWVIFLFLMGFGGNGWGGFGNNGRGGLANEINNDYGRGLLMDAIGGNRNALSNLATQLNCTEGQIQSAISALTSQVQSVGNQVGMSGMQTIKMPCSRVICRLLSRLQTAAARTVWLSASRLEPCRMPSTM